MTAPAYRSQAVFTYASNANSVTIAKPTGTVDGDIMLAFIASIRSGADGLPLTPPAGWTAVTALTLTGPISGFYCRFQVWWKRAASEGANYTFTHTGTAQSDSALIISYSGGIASGNPIDAFSTNSGTGVTATALSITTTVVDTMLIACGSNFDAAGATPITGATERYDHVVTESEVALAATGATGNKTYTSGSASGSPWTSWLIALKPVASAGGGGKPAKVWSGSAWVTKPVKVWSGSAWVTKPAKVWNGSAWV